MPATPAPTCLTGPAVVLITDLLRLHVRKKSVSKFFTSKNIFSPRLVPHSTCPLVNSFVIGTAVMNKHMSFTVPLPPRTQLYNRSCSNKHTHNTHTNTHRVRVTGDGPGIIITCSLGLKTEESSAASSAPPARRGCVCVFITAGPREQLCNR